MATVGYTDLIAIQVGSVGWATYAKNKGGAYRKIKPFPTNPQTVDQIQVRSIFTGYSQLWRGLTDAQRATWNNGAINFPTTNRIGDEIILSGFNLFKQLNQNLNTVAISTILVCPAPQAVSGVVDIVGLDWNPTISYSSVDPATIPVDHAAQVWATPGFSAGISSSYQTRLRLIGSLPTGVVYNAGGVLGTINAFYLAKFGFVPALTTKAGFGFRQINTVSGQASTRFTTLAISV